MESPRRLRTFLIPADSVVPLFSGARRGEQNWDFVEGAIPPTATLIRADWDARRNALAVTVEHESFAAVRPGRPIPRVVMPTRAVLITKTDDPDDIVYYAQADPEGDDLWHADSAASAPIYESPLPTIHESPILVN